MLNLKRINYIDLTIVFYVFCAVISNDGSYLMKFARLLLFGVCVLNALSTKRLIVNQHIGWLVGFLLLATVSILWAERTEFALSMSKTLVINAICMCALVNLVDNRRERVGLILKCMIYMPILLEIRVILSAGIFVFIDTRSVCGLSANVVGLCAGFGACYAVYYYLREKNNKYLLLALMNCLIVVLSCSKKALLSVCLPFGIVYVFNRQDSLAKHIVKCIVLMIAGVLGLLAAMKILVLYNLIGHRIEGVLAFITGNMAGVDGSTESRALLISRGLSWFREQPWLGYGIDNFRVVLARNHPTWPINFYAHNNFVELLVDVGFVGFSIYYGQYIYLLRLCTNNNVKRTNADLMICSMIIALAIVDYALVSYYDKYIQLLLLTFWFAAKQFPDNNCVMDNKGDNKWRKFRR